MALVVYPRQCQSQHHWSWPVFGDQNRQVAVRSGTPGGLGTKLGLAARGTRIVEINGKAIRSPADLQTVDSMIQQGKVTRLQIKAIKPDGTSGVIVYPN